MNVDTLAFSWLVSFALLSDPCLQGYWGRAKVMKPACEESSANQFLVSQTNHSEKKSNLHVTFELEPETEHAYCQT